MGRRKIEIARLTDTNNRQVTFSKRRTGLFKKANELSILCGAEVAIVVFSPGNKPYSFGHPAVDVVAAKFLKQECNPNTSQSVSSSKVVNINKYNKQLVNFASQLRDEQEKGAMFDETIKQFAGIETLTHLQMLHASLVKLKENVRSYSRDVEAAETLILFSEKPVKEVKRCVSKRNKKI
ncbi:hypothetical protein RJT34_22201 [Clitoria ternatea]|uniref:MADS-box domain-containing protein n=1 Tax=Clitoria ternatea TaxID=43366 RepID=A0AAN9P666_CLITE